MSTEQDATHPERAYLELLAHIRDHGTLREGRNGGTRSVFGASLRFDMRHGFPLLTTKRMYWRGIVEELLWFLRGDTDAGHLQERRVHIWDGNSTRAFLDARGLHAYPEGVCGPIYGWQWRRFNAPFTPEAPCATEGGRRDGEGADQLRYVLDELVREPNSRRAMMTAWNPLQLDAMCLPPCHVSYTFYVHPDSGRLSCHMYQRSCDAFLGEPFNIASTALLTTLVAALLHREPGEVYISITDAHIYLPHLPQVASQVARAPMPLPTVRVRKPVPPLAAPTSERLAWLESLTFDDIVLEGYACHPAIPAPMIS